MRISIDSNLPDFVSMTLCLVIDGCLQKNGFVFADDNLSVADVCEVDKNGFPLIENGILKTKRVIGKIEFLPASDECREWLIKNVH